MRLRDYHILPKFRDGLGYLYLERGKIEQTQRSIEFFDKEGRTLVPASALGVLMLVWPLFGWVKLRTGSLARAS